MGEIKEKENKIIFRFLPILFAYIRKKLYLCKRNGNKGFRTIVVTTSRSGYIGKRARQKVRKTFFAEEFACLCASNYTIGSSR
jgi:hypothetical protein